jgi:hypothetical protein
MGDIEGDLPDKADSPWRGGGVDVEDGERYEITWSFQK